MDAPLVSVLMTSFNREKYIAQAIESVLNSSYSNFELIVVDDCSTDNTVSIARQYAAKDKRIQVHINKINLGDYPNRNQAATYAAGKYLKYVDADDMIYPWGLDVLVTSMEKFPDAGYGLCSLDQDQRFIFPVRFDPAATYRYEYEGPGLFHKAPLSAVIKTEVFKKAGGFNNIRMCGDFEMWHRLSFTFPVVLMPHGLVWYRKHEGQEMNHFIKFAINYVDIRLSYITRKDCPLDIDILKAALKQQKDFINKMVKSRIIRLQFSEAKSWKKLIESYNL